MAILIQLTAAGIAAVTAAAGTNQTVIAELGLTEQPFFAAPTLTALPGEFKRLQILSGTAPAPNIIHVTAYDQSAEVWNATGFGFFLEDGTLFATYSAAEPVLSKAALAFALMGFDIAINADLAAQITFGDATFVWPPATTTTRGVARIARQERVDAAADGEDDADTIVTPKTLRRRIASLLTAITGAVSGEAQARSDADQALHADIQTRLPSATYTAADVLAKLVKVDGAGSDLDADLLDGFHGQAYDRIIESHLTELDGYEVYASGKKVTWGRFSILQDQYATFSLPTPHTSWVNPVLGISSEGANVSINENTGITEIIKDASGAPTGVRLWNADNRTVTVWIRTLGV